MFSIFHVYSFVVLADASLFYIIVFTDLTVNFYFQNKPF